MSIFLQSIAQFLTIYWVLLLVRILLSWFPNVDWSNPFFGAISQLTDPYLNLFRSIVPSFGGLDFSPILAFLLLQFVSGQLSQLAMVV